MVRVADDGDAASSTRDRLNNKRGAFTFTAYEISEVSLELSALTRALSRLFALSIEIIQTPVTCFFQSSILPLSRVR